MIIRRITSRWRMGASILALAGLLAISLTMPIPAVPDDGVARVRGVVEARLPGWSVERVARTWEGAYSVVALCAGRQVGFQYVPGHGLTAEDAWLQPSDPFSRERLETTSDHWRYLLWYSDPAMLDSLSCSDEIAGAPRSSTTDSSEFD
jgi:hypothetical protein